MKINKIIFSILVLAAGILLVVYFFRPYSSRPSVEKDKPMVVTTVSPLTNIVHNIGGDRIRLFSIIPEGTDSHTFEPSPSDVRILATADLIIINGLHLETPTEKLALSVKKNTTAIYRLGDHTISEREWIYDFSFPVERGDPNPHLWMNPQYAIVYTTLIRDQLVSLDGKNKEYYEGNTRKYLVKLQQLDKAVDVSIRSIPPGNRKLLTYHDSWAYFARRYGMDVIGAMQPSDFKEPSPKEVTAFIDQLKKENIPAVFGSEVYPSKILNQIAKEAKVQWVATLRDDSLPGEKNSREHTYIGMMIDNMRNMVVPLGGNVDVLKEIDPGDVSGQTE